MSFVDRFDANSYLYITRAMDYFDLSAEHNGSLAGAFMGGSNRHLVVSFDSDWLFTTAEAKKLVHALNAAGQEVSFLDIHSDKGHDAFLLDEPELDVAVSGFLASTCGMIES
jgi:Homoserine acetyltransferase